MTAPFSYRFIINPLLEKGLGFAEIARHLELDPALLDYDIFAHYKEIPGDTHGAEKILATAGTNYIVFYFSSRHFNTTAGFNRGALWRPEDWVELGRRLHEASGCRIVITGAAYDLDYLRDFVRLCGADFHDIYINIVGQYDIIDTREVLKQARMIIEYPSGIPIMGVYLNTPTAMFWRPRHLPFLSDHEDSGFDPAFARVWVPPHVLKSGRYIDLWFGEDTPETVFAKITGAGW